ncbi:tetratricopeptide repeat-containing sulfotransferase family protein [Novosphingobium malaysiense]|uniref:tetratricopeptide repeat-containing sulfotransferase family protein n=1 Tax=Novosphingobium malaysiense TaxID=1348853 RepID=UPI0009DF8DE1|nr:tetratricopeptide repeat-containing sulfotransferase family protein [Novosphingobium malaysiense]
MTATTSPEQLSKIAQLARTGRLDEAALRVAEIFVSDAPDPVLAALGGAVEFHRGRFDRAVPYLEHALRLRPRDLTIRNNLAESYFRLNESSKAYALCDDEAVRADESLKLARLGGHIAQETGDFDRAAELYRFVLAKQPEDWALWNNLGTTLISLQDYAEAAEALRKAKKLAPDAPPIRVNLGNALFEGGAFEEAEAVLREAVRDFPEDEKPHLRLADYFRAIGDEYRALAELAEAARKANTDPEVLFQHAQQASQLNEYDAAEASYEAALALQADHGSTIMGLAALLERTNREDELESLRARAEASAVEDRYLAYIDALRFKRVDRFEDVLVALDKAGDAVAPNRRHQLRGLMLDRLGRYDEAFAEFTAMNADRLADPSRPAERGKAYFEHVEACRARVSSEWVAQWSQDGARNDDVTPAFLLGFPRSGTTLLDTMLMGAPDVLVLEEESFVVDLEYELGGIEALPALSTERIAEARRAYFERAARLGTLTAQTLIVDKHPLHVNKIPIIKRLFPKAKFIFAMRHPCDVLLSCYITNFRTNHAMSNFLDLETTAQLYDTSLAYWNKAREIFELPVATVVYERLVADQARELQPLLDWLGVSWEGRDLDHREMARNRGFVRTASYSQVTEPLYTRSAGRWRRYESHLAPVLEVLRPWVEQFGYSLEDDRVPRWGEPRPTGSGGIRNLAAVPSGATPDGG